KKEQKIHATNLASVAIGSMIFRPGDVHPERIGGGAVAPARPLGTDPVGDQCMESSPNPASPVNPTPATFLCVAPSPGTCPRRVFPTAEEATGWGLKMSAFYKVAFAVCRQNVGGCLTLESLISPPRYGEVRREQ